MEPHEEPNNPSPTPPDLNAYSETPYLFISTDSGRESGFMYLDWVIVTYGVPYVLLVASETHTGNTMRLYYNYFR